jgi:hypothetical protein
MKEKCFYIVTFLVCVISSEAQSKISILNACSYYGEKNPSSVYTFNSDVEASSALRLITDASGLATNFKIMAANIPNAAAIIYNNERYILYNQSFMYNISKKINYWASISILAHEVGHHLNGHSLLSGGSRPSIELEADKFSGFVLAKLGANLEEAQYAINSFVSEYASATHPGKSARLAAIANGWYSFSSNFKNAQNQKIDIAKRPKSIFTNMILGKGKTSESLYFKKIDKYQFKILSESGYEFFNKEYREIKITDDILIFWFPDYEAYGYIDSFSEIKAGQTIEMKYGNSNFRVKSLLFPKEYINMPGKYLIVYYPNGGFNIFVNGLFIDNPQEITNLSYWQIYPKNVKQSTGQEDDYYYVYKLNDGIKDVFIQVSRNQSKEAEIQKKYTITAGFLYNGGPINF